MSKTRIIVLLIVICTCLSRCGSMIKGKKVEKHKRLEIFLIKRWMKQEGNLKILIINLL